MTDKYISAVWDRDTDRLLSVTPPLANSATEATSLALNSFEAMHVVREDWYTLALTMQETGAQIWTQQFGPTVAIRKPKTKL